MARLQTTLLCLNCPWIQRITATLTFLTARRGKTANLRIRNVFHTKLRKSSALIDQSIDLASLQTAMETKESLLGHPLDYLLDHLRDQRAITSEAARNVGSTGAPMANVMAAIAFGRLERAYCQI